MDAIYSKSYKRMKSECDPKIEKRVSVMAELVVEILSILSELLH